MTVWVVKKKNHGNCWAGKWSTEICLANEDFFIFINCKIIELKKDYAIKNCENLMTSETETTKAYKLEIYCGFSEFFCGI